VMPDRNDSGACGSGREAWGGHAVCAPIACADATAKSTAQRTANRALMSASHLAGTRDGSTCRLQSGGLRLGPPPLSRQATSARRQRGSNGLHRCHADPRQVHDLVANAPTAVGSRNHAQAHRVRTPGAVAHAGRPSGPGFSWDSASCMLTSPSGFVTQTAPHGLNGGPPDGESTLPGASPRIARSVSSLCNRPSSPHVPMLECARIGRPAVRAPREGRWAR